MRKEVVVAAAAVTVGAAAVGVAVFLKHWEQQRERRLRQAKRLLRKFANDCATPVAKLWNIADDLASKMESGLSSEESILGMLVSYVAPLPTGEEKGIYYGINLRGTNFLMIRGSLGGKNLPISELQREEVAIPSTAMDGDSTKELFDLIAVELAKFISVHSEIDGKAESRERKLGFTVSFPVEEDARSSGTAIKWRSLSVNDIVGKELTNDINRALEKHGIDLRVFALANDTTGDLAGAIYYSKENVAAITLGMGTDVGYVESAEQVPKWHGQSPNSGEMIINMQWGNFSSSHLPFTEFDASLDAESSNPGSRMFEKLISGMYLGEIVRRVLLKMAQETALFGEWVPPKLATPYLLRSPDMAAMHQDTSEDFELVDEKLKEIFEINYSTQMARELVAEVCDVVAERGARLVGAGIVGIVKKLGRIANKKSVVTIEGGLYEHYRVFRNYLHNSVWEVLGNDHSDNVIIENCHGGSGAGSIFLAASQTYNAGS
ncbi:probable hexokinase-like 2 protein [Olea europaea var. sylvestris]|uniref:probable hexokinase-like 2 protein n=1 Tax=Olea europaea var. sylvestris TaxID=158386 RepID=UPI000C1D63FB|nr:probable hexokinase-like 2 protein [Olea europaea var. sylvestris]